MIGLGAGAIFPQINLALQNSVPFTLVGIATASRLFFTQLSQTIASVVFGVILTAMLTSSLTTSLQPIKDRLPVQMAVHLDPQKLRNGGSEALAEIAALKAQGVDRFSTLSHKQLSRQVNAVLKQSFASSVVYIYSFGLPLILLALALGFAVPEQLINSR